MTLPPIGPHLWWPVVSVLLGPSVSMDPPPPGQSLTPCMHPVPLLDEDWCIFEANPSLANQGLVAVRYMSSRGMDRGLGFTLNKGLGEGRHDEQDKQPSQAGGTGPWEPRAGRGVACTSTCHRHGQPWWRQSALPCRHNCTICGAPTGWCMTAVSRASNGLQALTL